MVEVCKKVSRQNEVSTPMPFFFFFNLCSLFASLSSFPYRTTAFLAARYKAASTPGETVPTLEAEEEEHERISSSRRGIQSKAAASATIAPGALQIDAGSDRAAAGFC